MGKHNRFEAGSPIEQPPIPLEDQLSKAQDVLAYHPQVGPYAEHVEYNTLTPDQEATYTAAADNIFDTLGIVREEAVEKVEAQRNVGTSQGIVRLRRAADVAQAAAEFGYDRDAPDDELRDTANAVLEDLRALRTRAIQDGKFRNSREYQDKRIALKLLAESSARELGRRHGLGDDLAAPNLRAIQDKTGLKLVDSKPHEAIFKSVIPPRRYHHAAPSPVRQRSEHASYYYIPQLAGPSVPRHPSLGPGWVPARIGRFVLDPRYTGGRLPR